MPAPNSLQQDGPSGLNADLLPFRRRVDSSDEEQPERPIWPPRCQQIKFKDGDYEQNENVEPVQARRRKRAQRRANLYINAEAEVEGDANGVKRTADEIDDLGGFILVDDVAY